MVAAFKREKGGNRPLVSRRFELLLPRVAVEDRARAPGARLLSHGGEEGISAIETAQEGSAGSAKVLGNSLM